LHGGKQEGGGITEDWKFLRNHEIVINLSATMRKNDPFLPVLDNQQHSNRRFPMFKSSLIALALTLGASSAYAAMMVGGAEMFPAKNIIENAVNSKDHTTLVAAVKAAGLVDTLQGAGPFTVFAPTNEAFAALPAGTVDGLLKPEAKDTLTKVLTCHVVGAKAMSDAVMKMVKDDGGAHKVKTVGGCELTLKLDGDKVTVTDEGGGVANVTIADVEQSNGVIHVIDKVLLPKS
jgi:uncharacterized surface protein with fasciclin (FAS1) repeats